MTVGRPHPTKSACTGNNRGYCGTPNPPKPMVNPLVHPAVHPPWYLCSFYPSGRFISSNRGAHGRLLTAPLPINPSMGASRRWNICKVIWRWKKSFTPKIADLPFTAIATLLALNQILLREANSIFSLSSFAFYEIGNKSGREQREGTKGRRHLDMPKQPGGDREVRRGGLA